MRWVWQGRGPRGHDIEATTPRDTSGQGRGSDVAIAARAAEIPGAVAAQGSETRSGGISWAPHTSVNQVSHACKAVECKATGGKVCWESSRSARFAAVRCGRGGRAARRVFVLQRTLRWAVAGAARWAAGAPSIATAFTRLALAMRDAAMARHWRVPLPATFETALFASIILIVLCACLRRPGAEMVASKVSSVCVLNNWGRGGRVLTTRQEMRLLLLSEIAF